MNDPGKFMPVRVRIKGAGRVREAAKLLIGAGVGCVVGREANKRLSAEQRRAALRTLGLTPRS